jgi:cation diffusion facilitator CzcD-associated flavoprotein CzcO
MTAGMGDLSAKDRMKVVYEKGEAAVYSETEIVKTKVVVSCVGGLVEPRGWPDNIKGLEKFKGKVFHSARWDETIDFNDKNVVVVGTGCSSAQIVPSLPVAPYNAKSVTQLMRSPPWVVPSFPAPGGDKWWAENSPKLMKNIPGLKELLRFAVFAGAEVQFLKLFPNTPYALKHRNLYEKKVLENMRKKVPEKYHEIMTPDYGVGCKRRIFDKRWLKSLNDPKIDLTTQPLNRVTESGIVIGPGATYPPNATAKDYPEKEIPADIIVLANGFDTTRWLHPLKVVGKGGATDGRPRRRTSIPRHGHGRLPQLLHDLRTKHSHGPFQRSHGEREHGTVQYQVHQARPQRRSQDRGRQEGSRRGVYRRNARGAQRHRVEERMLELVLH